MRRKLTAVQCRAQDPEPTVLSFSSRARSSIARRLLRGMYSSYLHGGESAHMS